MSNILSTAQDYPQYIAIVVIILIIGSVRNEDFRNWVIRLTIFGLIILACSFGFQKIKYRFQSGTTETNPFSEEGPENEYAGHKYYKDPAEEINKQIDHESR